MGCVQIWDAGHEVCGPLLGFCSCNQTAVCDLARGLERDVLHKVDHCICICQCFESSYVLLWQLCQQDGMDVHVLLQLTRASNLLLCHVPHHAGVPNTVDSGGFCPAIHHANSEAPGRFAGFRYKIPAFGFV